MSRVADLATATMPIAFVLITGCALSVPCDLHDKQYGLLCAFAAQRELPERHEGGLLIGSVQVEPPPAAPIVVFVYRTRKGQAEVVDSYLLQPHGPYSFAFTVPAGVYRLAAFEDEARDFRYDPSHDRAALYHDGGPIVLMPRQTVDRIYLRLRNDRPQRIDFDFTLTEPRRGPCCQSPDGSVHMEQVRDGAL